MFLVLFTNSFKQVLLYLWFQICFVNTADVSIIMSMIVTWPNVMTCAPGEIKVLVIFLRSSDLECTVKNQAKIVEKSVRYEWIFVTRKPCNNSFLQAHVHKVIWAWGGGDFTSKSSVIYPVIILPIICLQSGRTQTISARDSYSAFTHWLVIISKVNPG